MNSGNRILHQIMKHREHARQVREGSASTLGSGDAGARRSRPESAVSYDIGIPLRLSEPSSASGQPLTLSLRGTAVDRGEGSRASSPVEGATDARPDASCDPGDHPPDRVASAGSTRRPPSPYRRPVLSDDPAELKRFVAQLQARVLSVEVQLARSNQQRRYLAAKLRRCKRRKDSDDETDDAAKQDVESNASSAQASAAQDDVGHSEVDESSSVCDAAPPTGSATLLALSDAGDASLDAQADAARAAGLHSDAELVRQALGEAASERFRMAVDVHHEWEIHALLSEACRKLVTVANNGERAAAASTKATVRSPQAVDEARQRHRALVLLTREGKTTSKAARTQLEALKHETSALHDICREQWRVAAQVCHGAVQLQQLVADAVDAVTGHISSIKSMILGAPPLGSPLRQSEDVRSLSIANLGCCLDHCLATLDQLCRRGEVAVAGVARCRGRLEESSARSAALLDSTEEDSKLLRATTASLVNVKDCMMRAANRCTDELERTLHDSPTEEDILCAYQDEMDVLRQRLSRVRCDGAVQTDVVDGTSSRRSWSAADITVPTTTSADGSAATTPVSLSRPGSTGRSKAARAAASKVSATTTSTAEVSMPPILRSLVSCVHSLHIAFTEALFGPVRCSSQYRTIEAQRQAWRERQERLSALGETATGAPATVVVRGVTSTGGAVLKQVTADGIEDKSWTSIIGEHIRVLPSTFGELLQRDLVRGPSFPLSLSADDEQDLATHIDTAQRLVDIGMLWHEALGQTLRVHHSSQFLFLVRRSRPMRSAYFFHDTSLTTAVVAQELQNSAPSFCDALRDVLWTKGRSASKEQKRTATQTLLQLKLLRECSDCRAKLNWKGLVSLHKHTRMKQLMMQALATDRDGATPQLREENLRRIVSAFYNDLSVNIEAEQRIMRTSLRITIDALWTELIVLLRQSAELCYCHGINLEAFEVLGPEYSYILSETCQRLVDAVSSRAQNASTWPRIAPPTPLERPRHSSAAALSSSTAEPRGADSTAARAVQQQRGGSLCDESAALPSEGVLGQRIVASAPRSALPDPTASPAAERGAPPSTPQHNRNDIRAPLLPTTTGLAKHDMTLEAGRQSCTVPPLPTRKGTGDNLSGGLEGIVLMSSGAPKNTFPVAAVLGSDNPWIIRPGASQKSTKQ